MSWFNRKKEDHRVEVAKTANLEIVAAKQASEKATDQAIKDANNLKDLLERNHFSVTLYIAVGGKNPRKQTRKKTNA
jgi:hypothetical protein